MIMIGLILVCSNAMAEPCGYGISFGYGSGNNKIDIYRVGIKKDFSARWFETNLGSASGYFELSYNRWEYDSDDIDAVAFSPVFTYAFGDPADWVRPYVEGGVGLAYLDEYRINQRNLSTHFQFENRIGIGARISFVDVNVRYMHYSNASIKGPNDGIDIWLFTTAIQF
jgi:lipid A 3-O-deacylase